MSKHVDKSAEMPASQLPMLEPTRHQAHPITQVLERYLTAIRGIGQTARIALPHIAKWTIAEIEKTQRNIEKFVPDLPKKGDGPKTFTLDSARDFAEFTSTIRQLEDLRGNNSSAVLAKSLFTQLFAEFDAYIGDLLKVVYIKNDKLLKGISREISLSDLLDFGDINSISSNFPIWKRNSDFHSENSKSGQSLSSCLKDEIY
jgi:hypothetical protein